MTDSNVTRRRALLTGATLGGTAALLASRDVQAATPARKWDASYSGGPEPARAAPGVAGRDYQPVITPNGATLPWKVVDGVKVYHLIAEEVDHEFAPGLRALCWGYNGRVHGPTIEAVEGDRVRVYVTNRLKRRPPCTGTASSCRTAWTASAASTSGRSRRARPSATSGPSSSTAPSCITRTTTR
jgi:FtsP/CotA-like multicopper oxidase with cupredoxin domain